MKKYLGLALFAMLAVFASAAFALDNIGDLHNNDANGVCVSPYAYRDTVNIRGIVTAEFTSATVTYTRAFLQDATGGVNIYKFATGAPPTHICFQLGDDVSIGGHIEQYNGLTEVIISTYTINSTGNPLPAPKDISVTEFINTFNPATYREINEGLLVRIKGVHLTAAPGNWTSANWQIADDAAVSDTLYVYGVYLCGVNPMIGTPRPIGPFDVTGILGQFDKGPVWDRGYQITPRGAFDIVQPGTNALPSNWGRVKAMYK